VATMNFTDTLRINILSSRAVEAGADPDRTWPIVVFAPPGPSYRLKTVSTGAMIMTRGFWAVTVEALQEMAKISITVPCFNDHSNASSGDPRMGKHYLIPSDPTLAHGRIGDIYALTWDADLYAVIGMLEAVPEWDDKFMAEWKDGILGERGFSFSIYGDGAEWRPNTRAMKSYTVYDKIDGLFSIDLVTYPAAGGRFLLPGCERTYETTAQAELNLFKYTEGVSLWIDDEDNESGVTFERLPEARERGK